MGTEVIVDGRAQVLGQLYAEHQATLTGYARRLLDGDRGKAEDAVQETLLRAWQNADRLSGAHGSPRSWLLRVTHNVVIDMFRAAKSRPTETDGTIMTFIPAPDRTDSVLTSVTVKTALRSLPIEHRAVLAHLYLRGHTITEVAKELDIPPGTVKSRAHNALRKLRLILDGADLH